ncbi:MAG TPA: helix-turn-helix domain-containing protein [Verrucomicrobiae bacterium]|nr:helix-turn-helix domain-containing protein [Verrucomicrobiae bacterium]
MKTIGEVIKEKNIMLDTLNPVLQGGFTQVPNFILKDAKLSLGAKVTYSMFLSYAWSSDFCFPGQDRLAEDMGMSRSRVTEFVSELEISGLISIQRRGLGKTNIYTIHFQVKWAKPPEVGGPTSRGRPADIRRSAG